MRGTASACPVARMLTMPGWQRYMAAGILLLLTGVPPALTALLMLPVQEARMGCQSPQPRAHHGWRRWQLLSRLGAECLPAAVAMGCVSASRHHMCREDRLLCPRLCSLLRQRCQPMPRLARSALLARVRDCLPSRRSHSACAKSVCWSLPAQWPELPWPLSLQRRPCRCRSRRADMLLALDAPTRCLLSVCMQGSPRGP